MYIIQQFITQVNLFIQLFLEILEQQKQFILTYNFRKQKKRMTIFNKIKKAIKLSDFFYSSQMLRYQSEQEYRTLTGGLLSITIIVTIVIGFASMILDTLNLSTITTQKQVKKLSNPLKSVLTTAPGSHFMFGIQIWGLNLSDSTRYFDVGLTSYRYVGGEVVSVDAQPLQQCTHQHWAEFPQLIRNLDTLQASGWLCPRINQNIALYGKYTSDTYIQYYLSTSVCRNETDRPCASQTQIDTLFADNQNFFYFTLYFMNPVINPDQKDYKSYYLQDSYYVNFGDKIGSTSSIQFTDYTIETDNSIWPFEQLEIDTGCIVEDISNNFPFQINRQGTYTSIKLIKSAKSVKYNQQVQKISSVLSYMGGMIGAISAILFILKMYTSFSYQISIAIDIIKPDKNSNQNETDVKMNFFTFVKYWIYKFCKYVNITCKWPAIAYAEECQKQIMKQLDVKHLLRRLIFIQHCLTYLFEDYQLNGLQLKMPKSARQIRKIRQKCASVYEEQLQKITEGSQNIQKQQIDSDAGAESNQVNSPVLMNIVKNKFLEDDKKLQIISKDQVIKNRNTKSKKTFTTNQERSIHHQYKIEDIIEPIEEGSFYKIKSNVKEKKIRVSYINNLCQSAKKGNEISNKIWKQLQQNNQQRMMYFDENEISQKNQNK